MEEEERRGGRDANGKVRLDKPQLLEEAFKSFFLLFLSFLK